MTPNIPIAVLAVIGLVASVGYGAFEGSDRVIPLVWITVGGAVLALELRRRNRRGVS